MFWQNQLFCSYERLILMHKVPVFFYHNVLVKDKTNFILYCMLPINEVYVHFLAKLSYQQF